MSAPAAPLLDRLVLAVTGSGALRDRIAAGLQELGASVGGASDDLGAIDAVAHVMSADGIVDRPLVETDRDAWDRGAEAPIRETLAVLQGAFPELSESGGAIVLVVPTIALTGAPGLVALAAAAEGIRLLGKSAARAWGVHGIRVNTITAPLGEWAIEQQDANVVPSKFGPSLPERDVAADIAAAVGFLCGPSSGGISGATLGVDRGTLMAP